jgi:DNA-binding MarR family transcriptional regulator
MDEVTTTPSTPDYRPTEFGTIPWLIKHAEREVGKRLDRELHAGGVTKAQFGVLQALAHLKTASSAALARTVFVSPQAMVGIIVGLERKGFIVRRASRASARMLEARVTPAGMEAYRKGKKAVLRVDDLISSEFDPDEQALFISHLTRFVAVLQKAKQER